MVLMRFWSYLPSMEKLSIGDSMTRGVKVVIYRGGLKMFLKPLFKIFLLTLLYIYIYICILFYPLQQGPHLCQL